MKQNVSFSFFSLQSLWLVLLLTSYSYSQWNGDPTVNNVICASSGNQLYPVIASDGSGGAIIAWQDTRSGNNDIYARRITVNGDTLWAADGVAVCTASKGQQIPAIVSDEIGRAHV